MAKQRVGFARRTFNVAAGQTITGAASTLLLPSTRELGYIANNQFQNVIPEPGDLIEAWTKYYLTNADRRWGLEWHGIPNTGNADPHRTERLWQSVIKSKQAIPDVGSIVDWYRKGTIPEVLARAFMRNHGFTSDEYINWIINDSDWPSIEIMQQAFHLGIIDQETLNNSLASHGFKSMESQLILNSLGPPFSAMDIAALYHRRLIDRNEWQRQMKASGFHSPESMRFAYQLSEQIPTPSDLVRFAVREVWNPDVVRRFGYDDEYDEIPEFKEWMRRQGYVGNPNISAENRSGLDEWARAYWREHWQVMSPSQGYEAFHLLRPNRLHRFAERIPGITAFEFGDLQTLLKVADYPSPFRKWLAALSFRPMRLVDIYRLYEDRQIDANEVYELFLDRGYSPVDARATQQWLINKRENEEIRRQRKEARKEVVNAYRIGFIDKDEASQKLAKLGMKLRSIAITLANVDSRLANSNVTKAIAAVERQFIQWDIGEEKATEKLRTMGIKPERTAYYVQAWSYARESRGRRATAAMVARWVVRGLMSPVEARARLGEMGFDEQDAIKIVAVAKLDHGLQIARERRAEALTAKERQRAMENEIQQLEKTRKRMSARLLKSGTVANIRRWLKKGLIGVVEASNRLRLMDWHPADINRLIEEETGVKNAIET